MGGRGGKVTGEGRSGEERQGEKNAYSIKTIKKRECLINLIVSES